MNRGLPILPGLVAPILAAVLGAAGCLEAGCPGCDGSDPWDLAEPLMREPGAIEARLDDGTWAAIDDWPNRDIPVLWLPPVVQALDEDPVPTPQGGGGQEVAVQPGPPMPVLLRLAVQMPSDSTVEWVRPPISPFFHPEEGFETLGTAPPGEPFEVQVAEAGRHLFGAIVRDPAGAAIAYTWTTEALHVGASWTFDGQVQPQHPREEAEPLVEPAAMADRFVLPAWAEGRTLVASTEYRGVWVPGTGSDLNLALYDGEPREVQCSRTDGLGPAGTAESLNASIRPVAGPTAGKPFQVWVGYTPGFFCAPSFGEGHYANTTPVPYRLELALWPIDPAFVTKPA